MESLLFPQRGYYWSHDDQLVISGKFRHVAPYPVPGNVSGGPRSGSWSYALNVATERPMPAHLHWLGSTVVVPDRSIQALSELLWKIHQDSTHLTIATHEGSITAQPAPARSRGCRCALLPGSRNSVVFTAIPPGTYHSMAMSTVPCGASCRGSHRPYSRFHWPSMTSRFRSGMTSSPKVSTQLSAAHSFSPGQ